MRKVIFPKPGRTPGDGMRGRNTFTEEQEIRIMNLHLVRGFGLIAACCMLTGCVSPRPTTLGSQSTIGTTPRVQSGTGTAPGRGTTTFPSSMGSSTTPGSTVSTPGSNPAPLGSSTTTFPNNPPPPNSQAFNNPPLPSPPTNTAVRTTSPYNMPSHPPATPSTPANMGPTTAPAPFGTYQP